MRSFPITSVGYLGQAPMSLWGLLGVWVIRTGKCDWPLQAALSGSIIKAPGFAGGYLLNTGCDFMRPFSASERAPRARTDTMTCRRPAHPGRASKRHRAF